LPPAAINEGDPVTPRPSATVLLIRGRDPWQLLLMKRPGGADFAPDAYVFPGGAVHELFEEVGILLARRGKSFAREADCERVRGLTRRGTPFGAAVRDLALTPAFDRLVMLARW